MRTTILCGIGVLHFANGLWMWGWPMGWYQTIPGVADTGPFNMHFVRDIALIFLESGAGLIWATLRGARGIGLWAASWPCLHALFHIQIWIVMRAMQFDLIALSNLLGIQLPAWLALFLLLRTKDQTQ